MALNFDLTEEQNLLRQAVRDFAEREIAPVAEELDEREEFSVELTQKMGELGLLGCFVPVDYGGSDLGYVSYAIVVEELARVDGSQAATMKLSRDRTDLLLRDRATEAGVAAKALQRTGARRLRSHGAGRGLGRGRIANTRRAQGG